MDIKIKNLQAAQGILSQESFRIPILNLAIPKSPIPQIFVHQIEGCLNFSSSDIGRKNR